MARGAGGARPHVRAMPPWPPNEAVCKVSRLHNNCIYSMASHSRCQITPFIIHSCIMSSGILAPSPKYRCGHPAGHPKLLQLETPLVSYSYGNGNTMSRGMGMGIRSTGMGIKMCDKITAYCITAILVSYNSFELTFQLFSCSLVCLLSLICLTLLVDGQHGYAVRRKKIS